MSSGTTALPALRGPSPQRPLGNAAPQASVHDQVAWQREMESAQLSAWFKSPQAAGRDIPRARSAPPQSRQPAGPPPAQPHVRARLDHSDSGPAAMRPLVVMNEREALSANPQAAPPESAGPCEHDGRGQGARSIPPECNIDRPASTAEVDAVPDDAFANHWRAYLDAFEAALGIAGLDAGRSALASSVETIAPSSPGEAAAVGARSTEHLAASEQSTPVGIHIEHTAQGQSVWIALRGADPALAALLPMLVGDLRQQLGSKGQVLHQVVCNGRLLWQAASQGEAEIFETAFIEGRE